MSKDKTNQKGITLIALVITIIVMLILVGVSVTVALNGGLFSTAKEAAEGTATKRNEELQLSEGKVEINGEWYNSIDEYVKGESSNEPTEPEDPTGYTAYTIGQEVTIGTENFYVLKDSDATQETVTLLAKDCIDTNLVQSSSAGYVAFSSTNYWSSETEYPLDLNNYTIPADATSIITTAKDYGANLGGTGRLMTYEEAIALQTANSDILYGRNGKSSGTYLNYWLGSADDTIYVRYVGGYDDFMHVDPFDLRGSNIYGYAVRPVVEISKSSIS